MPCFEHVNGNGDRSCEETRDKAGGKVAHEAVFEQAVLDQHLLGLRVTAKLQEYTSMTTKPRNAMRHSSSYLGGV